MKHTMAKLIAIILITISLLFCVSCTYKNKSIYEENGISYYMGSNYCSVNDISNKAGKNVVIPAQVNGYTVTILDDRKALFEDLFGGYETLILPETIERVVSSFYDYASKKLKYNEYDNGLYLGTADNPYFAFIKVKEVDYAEEMSYKLDEGVNDPEKESLPPPVYVEYDTDVTSCTLHPDTKIIANNAFAGCEKLKSVTIPGGVKTIPAAAFAGCTSLVEVNLAEGVEIIASNAFLDCYSLNYIVLPSTLKEADRIFSNSNYGREADLTVVLSEGMEYIPDGLFEGCEILKNVSIPDSVKGIGDNAFLDCVSLEEINFPEGLDYIGDWAFKNCTSLYQIVIPNSLQKINRGAFYGCSSLVSVTFSDDLEIIDENSFQNSTSLENDVINGGLKLISEYAFAHCVSLKYFDLPESTEIIRDGVFLECSSLSEIHIPKNVISIGENFIAGCQNLKSITVDSENRHYCVENEALYNIYMTELIACTPNCQSILFAVPETVRIIWDYAFAFSRLEEINISGSVYKIGDRAFVYMSNLKEITFPNSVTYYGDNLFDNVLSIEKIVFGDGLTKIEDKLIGNCSVFEIFIPQHVKEIDVNALRDCPNLESIIVDSSNSTYASLEGNLYSKDYKTLYKYAQGKSIDAFVIPSTVENIASYAFSEVNNLKKVTIPSSVKTIEKYAFSNGFGDRRTTSFEEITIENGVNSIGDGAFFHCEKLKTIEIPDSVTFIDSRILAGCSSLESVILGKGITEISYNAFQHCVNLSTIVFKGNIEIIRSHAFAGCSNLNEITIPKSVKTIEKWAFGKTMTFNYQGTKAEWRKLQKNSELFKRVNIHYVICTNGKMTIRGITK